MANFPLPFRLVLSGLLVASVARAQTVPSTTAPASPAEPVQHLERVIVTAGPDPKSALDLAQGTAVLVGEDLHHQVQATLGQTLSTLAGVSAGSEGPGASRPLIRGLGGDRVRVLSNAIGALDASNVSPDHNTAIEPFFASSIEVLRGPSAILYGSSAVGGVVNVIDSTIPESPAGHGAGGALELRGATATHERAALLSASGGSKSVAVHVNALKKKTDDVRIPGVARIDAAAPPDQRRGILPDSATDTSSLAAGGTVFWATGRAGLGLTHYETEYGVPTDEPGLGIKMRQNRVDFSGAVTQPFGIWRSAQARFGAGDYRHAELTDGSLVHTTFTNRAAEGRLELVHEPLGGVTGTVGLQATRSDFAAAGSEVATPPSLTYAGALFALEEMKLGPRTTLQVGGRLEAQSTRLGRVEAARPAVPGYSACSDQRKRFAGGSGSVGLVFRPGKDWSIGAAVAYTERIPTTQELFSNGPHGGTAAYEVGTTDLRNEKSIGFDLTLRRRAGFVTGAVSAFVNRFNRYIFQEQLPATAIPPAANPENLTPYQFVARNAGFRGAEAEVSVHLLDRENQHVHLRFMADYVRTEQTTDHQPLPRTPPLRFGGGIEYEAARWHADLDFRRTDRQARLAPDEARTPGYSMIDASVSYEIPDRRATYELFLRGTNLGNVTAREHTSFLKEFAPLPRRGALAGVRVTF